MSPGGQKKTALRFPVEPAYGMNLITTVFSGRSGGDWAIVIGATSSTG